MRLKNLKKFTSPRQYLAAILLAVFTLNQAAPVHASLLPTEFSPASSFLGNIQIPEALGRVEEVYQGKTDELVLYIQDAHANYSAQQSIASLIDMFVRDHDFSVVGQEAAEGRIDTALLRAFPAAKTRREVMDRYLRRGDVGGSEYLAVAGDQAFDFVGVDKRKLYLKNLSEFFALLDAQESGFALVKTVRTAMKNLEDTIYSKSHREFRELLIKYRLEQVDLKTFLDELKKYAERLGEDLSRYKQLLKLFASDHPSLQDLDVLRLPYEIDELTFSLRARLAETPLEKELISLEEYLSLLKAGFKIELSRKDFLRLCELHSFFPAHRLVNFLTKASGQFRLAPVRIENVNFEIEGLFAKIFNFYKTASERDQVFVKQIRKEMHLRNKRNSILITGGFHKDGITKKLRQKGVSYMVIMPHIAEPDSRDNYIRLMEKNRSLLSPPRRRGPNYKLDSRLRGNDTSIHTLGLPSPLGTPEYRPRFQTQVLVEMGVDDPSLLRQQGIYLFGDAAFSSGDLLAGAKRWDKRRQTGEKVDLVDAVHSTATKLPTRVFGFGAKAAGEPPKGRLSLDEVAKGKQVKKTAPVTEPAKTAPTREQQLSEPPWHLKLIQALSFGLVKSATKYRQQMDAYFKARSAQAGTSAGGSLGAAAGGGARSAEQDAKDDYITAREEAIEELVALLKEGTMKTSDDTTKTVEPDVRWSMLHGDWFFAGIHRLLAEEGRKKIFDMLDVQPDDLVYVIEYSNKFAISAKIVHVSDLNNPKAEPIISRRLRETVTEGGVIQVRKYLILPKTEEVKSLAKLTELFPALADLARSGPDIVSSFTPKPTPKKVDPKPKAGFGSERSYLAAKVLLATGVVAYAYLTVQAIVRERLLLRYDRAIGELFELSLAVRRELGLEISWTKRLLKSPVGPVHRVPIILPGEGLVERHQELSKVARLHARFVVRLERAKKRLRERRISNIATLWRGFRALAINQGKLESHYVTLLERFGATGKFTASGFGAVENQTKIESLEKITFKNQPEIRTFWHEIAAILYGKKMTDELMRGLLDQIEEWKTRVVPQKIKTADVDMEEELWRMDYFFSAIQSERGRNLDLATLIRHLKPIKQEMVWSRVEENMNQRGRSEKDIKKLRSELSGKVSQNISVHRSEIEQLYSKEHERLLDEQGRIKPLLPQAGHPDSAVIVAAARSPLGRMSGKLKEKRVFHLAVHVVQALMKQLNLDPLVIESLAPWIEVILGTVYGDLSWKNIGKAFTRATGLPDGVTGMTINFLCGSSMKAGCIAVDSLLVGDKRLIFFGGVESYSQIPFLVRRPELRTAFRRLGPNAKDIFLPDEEFISLLEKRPKLPTAEETAKIMQDRELVKKIGLQLRDGMREEDQTRVPMAETAEILAGLFGITREEADQFALTSQMRAADAQKAGHLLPEIAPIILEGETMDYDEGVRSDTTLGGLAKLPRAFPHLGGITAGNASQLTDGSAAVALMKRRDAEKLGLKIFGTILSYATAGLSPDVMGLGPAYALPLAIIRAGLKAEDVHLWKINEAFAAQILAVLKVGLFDSEGWHNFPLENLNIFGGAIARGHPLGATGARLIVNMLNTLEYRDLTVGACSACIGGGMGIAMVIQRELGSNARRFRPMPSIFGFGARKFSEPEPTPRGTGGWHGWYKRKTAWDAAEALKDKRKDEQVESKAKGKIRKELLKTKPKFTLKDWLLTLVTVLIYGIYKVYRNSVEFNQRVNREYEVRKEKAEEAKAEAKRKAGDSPPRREPIPLADLHPVPPLPIPQPKSPASSVELERKRKAYVEAKTAHTRVLTKLMQEGKLEVPGADAKEMSDLHERWKWMYEHSFFVRWHGVNEFDRREILNLMGIGPNDLLWTLQLKERDQDPDQAQDKEKDKDVLFERLKTFGSKEKKTQIIASGGVEQKGHTDGIDSKHYLIFPRTSEIKDLKILVTLFPELKDVARRAVNILPPSHPTEALATSRQVHIGLVGFGANSSQLMSQTEIETFFNILNNSGEWPEVVLMEIREGSFSIGFPHEHLDKRLTPTPKTFFLVKGLAYDKGILYIHHGEPSREIDFTKIRYVERSSKFIMKKLLPEEIPEYLHGPLNFDPDANVIEAKFPTTDEDWARDELLGPRVLKEEPAFYHGLERHLLQEFSRPARAAAARGAKPEKVIKLLLEGAKRVKEEWDDFRDQIQTDMGTNVFILPPGPEKNEIADFSATSFIAGWLMENAARYLRRMQLQKANRKPSSGFGANSSETMPKGEILRRLGHLKIDEGANEARLDQFRQMLREVVSDNWENPVTPAKFFDYVTKVVKGFEDGIHPVTSEDLGFAFSSKEEEILFWQAIPEFVRHMVRAEGKKYLGFSSHVAGLAETHISKLRREVEQARIEAERAKQREQAALRKPPSKPRQHRSQPSSRRPPLASELGELRFALDESIPEIFEVVLIGLSTRISDGAAMGIDVRFKTSVKGFIPNRALPRGVTAESFIAKHPRSFEVNVVEIKNEGSVIFSPVADPEIIERQALVLKELRDDQWNTRTRGSDSRTIYEVRIEHVIAGKSEVFGFEVSYKQLLGFVPVFMGPGGYRERSVVDIASLRRNVEGKTFPAVLLKIEERKGEERPTFSIEQGEDLKAVEKLKELARDETKTVPVTITGFVKMPYFIVGLEAKWGNVTGRIGFEEIPQRIYEAGLRTLFGKTVDARAVFIDTYTRKPKVSFSLLSPDDSEFRIQSPHALERYDREELETAAREFSSVRVLVTGKSKNENGVHVLYRGRTRGFLSKRSLEEANMPESLFYSDELLGREFEVYVLKIADDTDGIGGAFIQFTLQKPRHHYADESRGDKSSGFQSSAPSSTHLAGGDERLTDERRKEIQRERAREKAREKKRGDRQWDSGFGAIDTNVVFFDFGGVLAEERGNSFAELVSNELLNRVGIQRKTIPPQDFDILKNLVVLPKPERAVLHTQPEAFLPWLDRINFWLMRHGASRQISVDEFKDIFFASRPVNPHIISRINDFKKIKEALGIRFGVIVNFEAAGEEHLKKFIAEKFQGLIDQDLIVISGTVGETKEAGPRMFEAALRKFKESAKEEPRNPIFIDNDAKSFVHAQTAGITHTVHYALETGKAPFTGDALFKATLVRSDSSEQEPVFESLLTKAGENRESTGFGQQAQTWPNTDEQKYFYHLFVSTVRLLRLADADGALATHDQGSIILTTNRDFSLNGHLQRIFDAANKAGVHAVEHHGIYGVTIQPPMPIYKILVEAMDRNDLITSWPATEPEADFRKAFRLAAQFLAVAGAPVHVDKTYRQIRLEAPPKSGTLRNRLIHLAERANSPLIAGIHAKGSSGGNGIVIEFDAYYHPAFGVLDQMIQNAGFGAEALPDLEQWQMDLASRVKPIENAIRDAASVTERSAAIKKLAGELQYHPVRAFLDFIQEHHKAGFQGVILLEIPELDSQISKLPTLWMAIDNPQGDAWRTKLVRLSDISSEKPEILERNLIPPMKTGKRGFHFYPVGAPQEASVTDETPAEEQLSSFILLPQVLNLLKGDVEDEEGLMALSDAIEKRERRPLLEVLVDEGVVTLTELARLRRNGLKDLRASRWFIFAVLQKEFERVFASARMKEEFRRFLASLDWDLLQWIPTYATPVGFIPLDIETDANAEKLKKAKALAPLLDEHGRRRIQREGLDIQQLNLWEEGISKLRVEIDSAENPEDGEDKIIDEGVDRRLKMSSILSKIVLQVPERGSEKIDQAFYQGFSEFLEVLTDALNDDREKMIFMLKLELVVLANLSDVIEHNEELKTKRERQEIRLKWIWLFARYAVEGRMDRQSTKAAISGLLKEWIYAKAPDQVSLVKSMQTGVGSELITVIVTRELVRRFEAPQREVRSFKELAKADQESGGKFSSVIQKLGTSGVDLASAFDNDSDDFSAGFGHGLNHEATAKREVIEAVKHVVEEAASESTKPIAGFETLVLGSEAYLERLEKAALKYSPAVREQVFGNIQNIVIGWEIQDGKENAVWLRAAKIFSARGQRIYAGTDDRKVFSAIRAGTSAVLLGQKTEYLLQKVQNQFILEKMRENGDRFIDVVLEALYLKQLAENLTSVAA